MPSPNSFPSLQNLANIQLEKPQVASIPESVLFKGIFTPPIASPDINFHTLQIISRS
jgi:hypothetical protein